MRKFRDILFVFMIIIIIFISIGCTGGQYTKDDIMNLKKYSFIEFYYNRLEFLCNNLIFQMDSFRDAIEGVVRGEDPDAVNYLNTIIKSHERYIKSLEELSSEGSLLIENAKDMNIDLSDINSVLDDIEKGIKFLDKGYLIAEEYIHNEGLDNKVIEMIVSLDIYNDIVSDNYYKCMERKIEFYKLIQDYN